MSEPDTATSSSFSSGCSFRSQHASNCLRSRHDGRAREFTDHTAAKDVTLIFVNNTPRLPGLTLADADWLVQVALEVGAERGFPPLAVAVIDVAGEVIVLRRGDGGMPMTSRIAVAKARTALRSC